MKLFEFGEDRLINHLKSRFNKNLPEKVITGIGDDCAVIQKSDNSVQLITSDLLIEGVHFLLNQTPAHSLGFKALAVNLSDIASMGGIPESAFLSLGVPKTTDIAWIDQFFDGFQKLSDTHHLSLLGGDLTESPTITINICLLGSGHQKEIRYRNTASVGDLICTTGFLGDAGAGRLLLEHSEALQSNQPKLINHFLQPIPHIQQGQWLAKQPEVHAMMDLSDGLAADLPRLIEASHVGATIRLDQLPISSELQTAAKQMKWDLYNLATCSGEDYCLLFTVSKEGFSSLKKSYSTQFDTPLFEIGEITQSTGRIIYLDHGIEKQISNGFTHFQNEEDDPS